jgi:hypothetical protein
VWRRLWAGGAADPKTAVTRAKPVRVAQVQRDRERRHHRGWALVVFRRLVEGVAVPTAASVALLPVEQVVVLESHLLTVQKKPLKRYLPSAECFTDWQKKVENDECQYRSGVTLAHAPRHTICGCTMTPQSHASWPAAKYSGMKPCCRSAFTRCWLGWSAGLICDTPK